MTNIALWVLAVAAIVIGIIGTVLPALPGVVLVFAGIALGAWIDGFTRVSSNMLIVIGVLALAAWATDYIAAAMGAKRAGASRSALVGAALGTVAGIFTGFIGLLFMPLVGAAVGEYLAQRDVMRAGRVGMATWIGMIIGTAVKLAIVFVMVGLFIVALLF
ncbi:MAG TPA: DUF456 domain-containing protein [Burkholderiaceae bacterium]|nr:DUF456 domain-containing protein [Burkholderiaceae bacterium]